MVCSRVTFTDAVPVYGQQGYADFVQGNVDYAVSCTEIVGGFDVCMTVHH